MLVMTGVWKTFEDSFVDVYAVKFIKYTSCALFALSITELNAVYVLWKSMSLVTRKASQTRY